MRRQPHSSGAHSASARPRQVGLVARACAAAVRSHQLFVRPLLPPACRYAPSCSQYAREAFLTLGAFRGGLLAIRRLARCNAWYEGGYDPVPSSKD